MKFYRTTHSVRAAPWVPSTLRDRDGMASPVVMCEADPPTKGAEVKYIDWQERGIVQITWMVE